MIQMMEEYDKEQNIEGKIMGGCSISESLHHGIIASSYQQYHHIIIFIYDMISSYHHSSYHDIS
jgi:hypothetical protein